MKTIQHTNTLVHYDGAQVFEARDTIGGSYVAVMVEPENGQDRYLARGVAPEQLRQFRSGSLDLRSLLVDASEEEWYLAATTDLTQPLTLVPQSSPLAESQFLPDAGFVLHEYPTSESVTLTGTFEKFDKRTNHWGLLTEEGGKSGKIDEGGPSIDGMVVGARYKFVCIETIEKAVDTGREIHMLYLQNYEPM